MSPLQTLSEVELHKEFMPFEKNILAKEMSQRSLLKDKDNRKSPTQLKSKAKSKTRPIQELEESKDTIISRNMLASLSGSDGSNKRVSVLVKEVDKDGKLLNP